MCDPFCASFPCRRFCKFDPEELSISWLAADTPGSKLLGAFTLDPTDVTAGLTNDHEKPNEIKVGSHSNQLQGQHAALLARCSETEVTLLSQESPFVQLQECCCPLLREQCSRRAICTRYAVL